MTYDLLQHRLPTLWAQDNLAHQWGSRFRGNHARFDSGDALALIAGVAIFVLVIWLLSRLPAVQGRMQKFHSPKGLIRELCRAHGLDRSSRQLLRALANHHQLQHPAVLFLEPERFQLSGGKTPLQAQRARITRLRDRIFLASAASPTPAVHETNVAPDQAVHDRRAEDQGAAHEHAE